MSWKGILIIILVLWAIVHSIMDFRQSKKLEELEKKIKEGR